MKCPKCGNDVAAGAKFCGTCGTAIPIDSVDAAAADSVPVAKKPLPVKKIGLFACVAIVAIIAITVCIKLFASSNYIAVKEAVAILDMSDDYEQVIVSHPNGNKETFDGVIDQRFQGSLDASKGAFAARTSGDEDDSFVSTLYYISDNKAKAFADTTGQYGVTGIMSADGSTVVWVADKVYENEYSKGTLYIHRDGKTQVITDSCFVNGRFPFCVSPDGKAVAYISDYDEEKDEATMSLWKDGESEVWGENLLPFAISNGGKLVYYIDNDKRMYVKKGDEKIKLSSDADIWRVVFLNYDNTSILVAEESGSINISDNGGEKMSLSGSLKTLLLPINVLVIYNYVYSFDFGYYSNSSLYSVNVKSFKDMSYAGSSGIYRITDKYEAERVVKSANGANLTNDGKTILYLYDGAIYKIDAAVSEPKEEKVCDKEVISFKAIGNGDAFYFLNEDEELYYQKGKGKPALISDGLDSGSAFAVFYKDDSVFYISDGELYSAKGGSKGSRVESVDSDSLSTINTSYFGIYIYNSSNELLYHSTDGITFKK